MTSSRPSSSFRWHADRWWPLPLGLLSAAAGSLALFIVVFLAAQAWPVLSHLGWADVFGEHAWYPLDGEFGMAGMLLATVLVSLGALLLAAPLGLGSALFMQFVAPPGSRHTMQWVLGLLAGTPSVVFGLWGLTVLVPWLAANHPPGTSLLTAALVLALMILPTVALTAASALQAVPRSLQQASDALGFSLQRHVVSVALPAARAGIVSGLVLALARALGETMAVLMVAGNVPQWPSSVLDPVRVLTANIALEMAYATGTHRAALFASGVVLAALVLALALLASRHEPDRHHA